MSFMPPPAAAVNRWVTVPAPVGGLNARDALAAMPETDAIVLNNWWVQPYGLQVRPGCVTWAQNINGFYGSLAVWNSTDGTSYLFAVGRDITTGSVAIYDVTNRQLATDPDPVPVFAWSSGSTDFESLQIVNDAGTHLFLVPGADQTPLVRNDSGFHLITCVAGPAPEPAADYTWYDGPGDYTSQLASHQGRLWGIDGTSSIGWYLPVDSIYGQWTAFDFGPQFTLGGAIHCIHTWTIDDGNGAEDHLVAISTRGQAVVYGGTNPEDITQWNLVGVYFIGEPVGIGGRCVTKVGGDLIVLTQQGLVSMAGMLISTKVNGGVNAVKSAKVQLLISQAVTSNSMAPEWQLFYQPGFNLFFINMPSTNKIRGEHQLACNLVTDSMPWTMFTGLSAYNWIEFENAPFFGTSDGRVIKGWTGWKDYVPLDDIGGTAVKTQVQQAYSFMGAPAVQKQVGMYRPGFLIKARINYGAVIEYDFRVRRLRIPSAGPGRNFFDLWDAGIWDDAVWAGGTYTDRRWIMADGVGTAVSLRMSMQSDSEILWVGTDYSYRTGTLL
jgi:hypothetical protein